MNITKLKSHMYDVVGAIHEVHSELGAGLNESCYQEGFEMELTEQGIPFLREMSFYPKYHGRQMSTHFRIDFLCKNNIIVECKSVSELIPVHRAQLFNYMRLLRKPCGILVNFAPKFATIERYLFDTEDENIMGMDGSVIHRL
ncbi:MAG: GxxExxY protein [Bacteroidales bacterium]|nr:GxxExxY protein [Bacteroidales bacterium]